MNSKYKYLRKNTVLFTISSFGTKILQFFLLPLYTSILTTSEYGTADIITTTATLLIYVLTIDIADGVLRYTIDIQNQYEKDKAGGLKVSKKSRQEQQESILSYGNHIILIATLICTLGLGVVYFLNVLDWPLYYYIFILLYFYATAFYQMMSNYLRGIDKITSVAIAGILSGLVTIICNILFLVVFKIGIVGYLLAMIMGPLVAALFCVIRSNAPIRVYFISYCPASLKREIRKYCVPLIFNNIALWVNASLDRYFVTAICGVDQNGIYSVASKIPNILAVFVTIFGQAWNLSAIKEYDPEDKDDFFGKTYRLYNAFMSLGCSLVILFNIPLAKFLYAKDFFSAWQYSSVLLLSIMFNALTMFIGTVFSAVKKTRVIATTTVISAICNTVLNALLIPPFGPLGAAVATVAAYVVMWLIRLIFARKYIKFHFNPIKDITVYILLFLQVVFEHLNGHMYLGQISCLSLIVILYHKQLGLILKKLLSKRLLK